MKTIASWGWRANEKTLYAFERNIDDKRNARWRKKNSGRDFKIW
jgi:hypothetical protein